jgi:hypothetical protein
MKNIFKNLFKVIRIKAKIRNLKKQKWTPSLAKEVKKLEKELESLL